ncbi:hypothetical protein PMAYCL1PPCAC_18933, partial [Pristionchus mayeri]
RMHVIDERYMEQTRPGFIGPKEAAYHIPAGPLLNRYWLEYTYGNTRDLVWDILQEKAAERRNIRLVREKIRNHERNCRNKATCRICNKPHNVTPGPALAPGAQRT